MIFFALFGFLLVRFIRLHKLLLSLFVFSAWLYMGRRCDIILSPEHRNVVSHIPCKWTTRTKFCVFFNSDKNSSVQGLGTSLREHNREVRTSWLGELNCPFQPSKLLVHLIVIIIAMSWFGTPQIKSRSSVSELYLWFIRLFIQRHQEKGLNRHLYDLSDRRNLVLWHHVISHRFFFPWQRIWWRSRLRFVNASRLPCLVMCANYTN